MHIVNPSGVKFTNKYLTWFRCLGLEDHGLGEGTNGGKKAASSKVGTALPCLPVRFRFCKDALFLIEGAPRHMLLKLSSHRFSYGILKANVETEAIISAHLAVTQ